MKKFISMFLALVLICCTCVIPAFAADVDAFQGTAIKLVGAYQDSTYTVTVPAELQPGQSGTVTLTGAWHANQTVNVTTPDKVTLYYGDQSMDVGINFAGISQVGSETEEISVTETVTVDDATALFGTWTGTLMYDVEIVDIDFAPVLTCDVECMSVAASGSYLTLYTYSSTGERVEKYADVGLSFRLGGFISDDKSVSDNVRVFVNGELANVYQEPSGTWRWYFDTYPENLVDFNNWGSTEYVTIEAHDEANNVSTLKVKVSYNWN